MKDIMAFDRMQAPPQRHHIRRAKAMRSASKRAITPKRQRHGTATHA
jgi:hypothetical protein